MLDVLGFAAVANVPIRRQCLVAAQTQPLRRPAQPVGGRETLHVGERADGRVLIPTEQEEVPDGALIQPIRYPWMQADTFEGVTEDVDLTPEMAPAGVPDGNGNGWKNS